MKPKVFIGSSSEDLVHAHALQAQLQDRAEVTVWNQGFFKPNYSFLENLLNGLADTDFGVFVFAPDDVVNFRGENRPAVRDNVLFELGLAMGRLGRERVFYMLPAKQSDLRLPSDLLGISTLTFDAEPQANNAGVRSAALTILQAIEHHGIRQDRLIPPSIESVRNPRVLCVRSEAYALESFQKDVDLIKRETEKIGAQIKELPNATTQSLQEELLKETFDLIHLCAYVDPRTGAIFFGPLAEGGDAHQDTADSMSAQSFAKLVELSRAKLVIVATCDSLILAAKLARICNTVAATDRVLVDEILKWELGLYICLSKGVSLSNAYETASKLSSAPMLLLLKKDLAFIG
jgi:hypothetical protein